MTPWVMAISNRKGGTGKTTTTVNLAVEFAMRGFRLLLIDLDSQGHAGYGLGIRPQKPEQTVHYFLSSEQATLTEVISKTVFTNVEVAPANQLFDHTFSHYDELRLAHAIQEKDVKDRFDMILIDTPPSLDKLLVSALAAAQCVLIPVLPHPLAAEGVKQLSRLFFRVATQRNPTLKLLGLVPVMADLKIDLHKRMIDGLSRQYGQDRLMRPIRADIKLAEAFEVNQPIQQYAPQSRGAMDYNLLAEEVILLWQFWQIKSLG